MHFGTNLSFLRKRKQLSQADLADEIEIKRSSLSGYELGNSEPNFETLLRFSAFFKISIDKLLKSRFAEDFRSILKSARARFGHRCNWRKAESFSHNC